jgi:hypothetical protein
MKKLFFLVLFTIFSFVFAQAIYGTKDSFFKSEFCKKYQCKLSSSTFSKKTGLGGIIWYISYKIKIPNLETLIDVSTHRDKNGTMIPSTTIYFPDVNVSALDESRVQMLSDFVYLIIGKRFKSSDFAYKCADNLSLTGNNYIIMSTGKTIVKLPNKSVSYILYCEIVGGGNPNTYTDDSIKFVISDDYHPR